MNRHWLAEQRLVLAQRFPVATLLVRPWVLIAFCLLLVLASWVPLVDPYAARRLNPYMNEFVWYEWTLAAAPLIPLAAWYLGLRGARMTASAAVRGMLLTAGLAILCTAAVLGIATARWSVRGDAEANATLCAEGLVVDVHQRFMARLVTARETGVDEASIQQNLAAQVLQLSSLLPEAPWTGAHLVPATMRCASLPTGTSVRVQPAEVFWVTPEFYLRLQEQRVYDLPGATIDVPIPFVFVDLRRESAERLRAQRTLMLQARAFNGDVEKYLIWHFGVCFLFGLAPLMALITLALLTSPAEEFHESQTQRSPSLRRWLIVGVAFPFLLLLGPLRELVGWMRAPMTSERQQHRRKLATYTALLAAYACVLVPEPLLGASNRFDATGILTVVLLVFATLIGSVLAVQNARFRLARGTLIICVCSLSALPAWVIFGYRLPSTCDAAIAFACAACAFLCAILAHFVRTASSPFPRVRRSQP